MSGHECGKCGESFDTERGLHVHQARAHEEESENLQRTVEITVRQMLIGVFVLGTAVGFSTGLLVGGMNSLQGANQNPSESGNQPSNAAENGKMEVYKNLAENVGADPSELESCVKESDGTEIDEDRSQINSVTGGIGTPSFFIGNSEIGYEQIEGAQPIDSMRPTIEEQLGEARNPGNDTVEEDEYSLEEVNLEGEPTKGDDNAPIRIIEYTDFGCPWCAEWFGVDAIPPRNIDGQNSYVRLNSDYVETGEVRFTLMDYPVPRLHPNAEKAHIAANCVYEQDQDLFWDFHDALFENRDQWMA